MGGCCATDQGLRAFKLNCRPPAVQQRSTWWKKTRSPNSAAAKHAVERTYVPAPPLANAGPRSGPSRYVPCLGSAPSRTRVPTVRHKHVRVQRRIAPVEQLVHHIALSGEGRDGEAGRWLRQVAVAAAASSDGGWRVHEALPIANASTWKPLTANFAPKKQDTRNGLALTVQPSPAV